MAGGIVLNSTLGLNLDDKYSNYSSFIVKSGSNYYYVVTGSGGGTFAGGTITNTSDVFLSVNYDPVTGYCGASTTVPVGAVTIVAINAQFTYNGYVPYSSDKLVLRLFNGETMPFSIVSRSHTGDGNKTNLAMTLTKIHNDIDQKNWVYKTGTLSTSYTKAFWLGRRVYLDATNYAIVRNWEQRGTTGVMVLEPGNCTESQLTLKTSFASVDHESTSSWACILRVNKNNPFGRVINFTHHDFSLQNVSICSTHYLDKSMYHIAYDSIGSRVDNVQHTAGVGSDKLKLPTRRICSSALPETADQKMTSPTPNNALMVRYRDGVWHLSVHNTSATINIRCASTAISHLYPVYWGVPPTLAITVSGEWVNWYVNGNANIVIDLQGDLQIQSSIPVYGPKGRIGQSSYGNYYRIAKPESPYDCDDTKPNLWVRPSASVYRSYLVSEFPPLISEEKRGLILSKSNRDGSLTPGHDTGECGVIFSKSRVSSSTVCTASNSLRSPVEEPFNGLIASLSQASRHNTNETFLFTHAHEMPAYRRLSHTPVSHTATTASTAPPNFSGRLWQDVPIDSNSLLLTYGNLLYNRFVMYAKRKQGGYLDSQESYSNRLSLAVYGAYNLNAQHDTYLTHTGSGAVSKTGLTYTIPGYTSYGSEMVGRQIWSSSRDSYAIILSWSTSGGNVNIITDRDFTLSGNTVYTSLGRASTLSHLMVVGRPRFRRSANHIARAWIHGGRGLWWDGANWNLLSAGGGSPYDPVDPVPKGGWHLRYIHTLNRSNTAITNQMESIGEDNGVTITLSGAFDPVLSSNKSTFAKLPIYQNGLSTGEYAYVLGGDSASHASYGQHFRDYSEHSLTLPNHAILPYYESDAPVGDHTTESNVIVTDGITTHRDYQMQFYGHMGWLKITPSAFGKLKLTKSRSIIGIQQKIFLGNQGWGLIDSGLTNNTQWTLVSGGLIWRTYTRNSYYYDILTFDQPITWSTTWDWAMDIGTKLGQKVTMALLPSDGLYHYDSGHVSRWANMPQKLRDTEYVGRSTIYSLFNSLITSDYEEGWAAPNLYLTWSGTANIWRALSQKVSGFSQGAGLAKGSPYLIEASTETSVDIRGQNLLAVYQDSLPNANKVSGGQSRTFTIDLANFGNSTVNIPANGISMYIKYGAGSKLVAKNSSPITLVGNAGYQTVDLDSKTGIVDDTMPEVYSLHDVELQVNTNEIGMVIVFLPNSIHVQKSPTNVIAVSAQIDYGLKVGIWEDEYGTGVTSAIRKTNGKQTHVTILHRQPQWLFYVKHYGDALPDDYASVSNIIATTAFTGNSSYIYTDNSTYYGLSYGGSLICMYRTLDEGTHTLSDNADTTLRPGEDVYFKTDLATDVNGTPKDHRGTIFYGKLYYYNNGIKEILNMRSVINESSIPDENAFNNYMHSLTEVVQPDVDLDTDFTFYGEGVLDTGTWWLEVNKTVYASWTLINSADNRVYNTKPQAKLYPTEQTSDQWFAPTPTQQITLIQGDNFIAGGDLLGDVETSHLEDVRHAYLFFADTYYRDYNGAPWVPIEDIPGYDGTAGGWLLDAQDVKCYNKISGSITSVTQLQSDGRLLVKVRFKTYLSNTVRAQIIINQTASSYALAFVSSADLYNIVGGSPVFSMNLGTTSVDLPYNTTGSYIVAQHPAMTANIDNESSWQLKDIPTVDDNEYEIWFYIAAQHWDFQGGRWNRFPSTPNVDYQAGLAGQRKADGSRVGPAQVKIWVRLQTQQNPQAIADPINNAASYPNLLATSSLSYQKPELAFPAQPAQNYQSSSVSLTSPGVTLFLPPGHSTAYTLEKSELRNLSWQGTSTPSDSMTLTIQNLWNSILYRCRDAYVNVGYGALVRPWSTTAWATLDDLGDAPEFCEQGERYGLLVRSGSNKIYVATSTMTRDTLRDYKVMCMLDPDGSPVTFEASQTYPDWCPGLGRWYKLDAHRYDASITGRVWNFETFPGASPSHEDGTQFDSVTTLAGDPQFNQWHLRGMVDAGNYNNPSDTNEDSQRSLVYDSELKQDVMQCDMYYPNEYLYYYYASVNTIGCTSFGITMKVPPFISHWTRLGSLAKVTLIAFVDNVVYTTDFGVYDDGQWHTYDIALPSSMVSAQGLGWIKILFHIDSQYAHVYGNPIRNTNFFDSTKSSGIAIRVANINFKTDEDAQTTYDEYTISQALNGDDIVRVGVKGGDWSGYSGGVQTYSPVLWNYSQLIFVRPTQPGLLTIKFADTTDGTLRARLVDIDVNGETSTSVQYAICYFKESDRYNYSAYKYLYYNNQLWATKAQWLSTPIITDAMDEGEDYIFYATARNPAATSYPTIPQDRFWNAGYANPIELTFYSGWIMPIVVDCNHASRAIINSNAAWYTNYETVAERKNLEFGETMYYNAYVSTTGRNFKAKWNPYGAERYSGDPLTITGSQLPYVNLSNFTPGTDHNIQVSVYNFKNGSGIFEQFAVLGVKYRLTYGAASKFDQPSLSDSSASISSDVLTVNTSFTSTYRGYAYLHLRPYFNDSYGTPTLFDNKYTVHLAIYLDYEDGINPSIPAIVDGGPWGYNTASAPTMFSSGIYYAWVRPVLVEGFSDDTGVAPEETQRIKYVFTAYRDDIFAASGDISSWITHGTSLTTSTAPKISGLEENAPYQFSCQSVSEGGAWGIETDIFDIPEVRTVIRPAYHTNQKSIFTNVIPSGDYMRATIALPPYSGAGYLEVWDYHNNSSLASFPVSGVYNTTLILGATPNRFYGLVGKLKNEDNFGLDDLPTEAPGYSTPFDKHSQASWKQDVYTYWQPSTTPNISASFGYKSGTGQRFFRLLPSLDNYETDQIYTGNKVITDTQFSSLSPMTKYAARIYKKDPNGIVTFLGFTDWGYDADNPGDNTYMGDILAFPSWRSFNEISNRIYTYGQVSPSEIFGWEYGFSIACRTETLLYDGQNYFDVFDRPEGYQISQTEWSDIYWTKAYQKSEDDPVSNLHLYSKWKYDPSKGAWSAAEAVQDLTDMTKLTTLQDVRVSFKIIESETSMIEYYPTYLMQLPMVDLPNAAFYMLVMLQTDIGTLYTGLAFWGNQNRDGTWGGGYGINEKPPGRATIHDELGAFTPSATSQVKPSVWYHVRYNLYEDIMDTLLANRVAVENLTKVRVRLVAMASRGYIYGNTQAVYDGGLPVNLNDIKWQAYDETQIGVSVRNVSIGWTQQVDTFGRKLYDEKAWNGEYYWRASPFAYKYNTQYTSYLQRLRSTDISLPKTMPNKFHENRQDPHPLAEWYYDQSVKRLLEDKDGN